MIAFTSSITFALVLLFLGTSPVDAQFSVYNSSSLDNSLGDGCIQALSATIDCSPFVQTFQQLSYRTDLDVELTDSICTADCLGSLKSWFDTVGVQCSGKTVSGGRPTRFGGYMWAGYNETCVRSPRPPRAYCNNIIANFTIVSSIQEMPQSELCHTCHVRRLALMQASQYSVYDENYKEQLEYIYTQCGLKGPTDIPPPLDEEEPVTPPYCLSGKRYTTTGSDTCESIANISSVSAAYLYMGNQNLLKDCSQISSGLSACLPLTCITHYVQPSDTCFSIERSLNLEYDSVQRHNSWVDGGCTNLQSATDFYGKVICVSPQGGTFANPVAIPGWNPTPVPADGHTNQKVSPPDGVKVAEGTTTQCGRWHVVAVGDSCAMICVANKIEAGLFHEVNPSLANGTECDSSLQVDTALCAGPTYSWNSRTDSPSVRL
ncbi:hypothetical protein HBI49_061230 [Parastagonospora nodorum]|nr:hypothetical protein HBI49_061230 [Parastagonospora nodorum]KAH5604627.1 hypothetical protein HBI45_115070 [Parastagonospora nodorum]KAH5709173.1 hypothetical protein HBI18_233920 [Parastagonospora nodorum]